MAIEGVFNEALCVLKAIPAYQQASIVASATDLLSISQPGKNYHLLTPRGGPFHLAGGNTNLFSHGMQTATVHHLNKS